MNRTMYLTRLAGELARWVPEHERQDILRWYEEYFDEAGPENEAAVIVGLGDPAALARTLAEERGYVTPGRRGPQLWQIIVGAVVVVMLSIPIMAIAQFVTFGGLFGRVFTVWTETSVPEPWDDPSYWEEPYETIPITVGDGLIDVSINVIAGDVTFYADDREEPYVSFSGSKVDMDNVGWDFDGSYLWVWSDEGSGWNGFSTSLEVTVIVPESWELGDVSLSLNMGDVDLGEFQCRELYVNTEKGDIQANGIVAADYASVSTEMGDIAYTSLLARDTFLRTELGDVTVVALDSAPSSYSYSLNTSLGEVRVDGHNYGQEVYCTVSEYSPNYGGYLNVTASKGDIDLTFAAGNNAIGDNTVTVIPDDDALS